MADKLALQARRRARLRYQLKLKSGGRPRLSVFRSGRHIYAQVIDDAQGRTVAAASTLEKTMREGMKTGADKDAATAVGKLVAERALAGPISITAASRRWRRLPARAVSPSEDSARWHVSRGLAVAARVARAVSAAVAAGATVIGNSARSGRRATSSRTSSSPSTAWRRW
jgi:large subunit ribosomal protein L18